MTEPRETRDIVIALEARFDAFAEHYEEDRKKLKDVHTAFVQMQGAGKLARIMSPTISGAVGFVGAWLTLRFPWLAPTRIP